jgi:signal transduction histidine kinase
MKVKKLWIFKSLSQRLNMAFFGFITMTMLLVSLIVLLQVIQQAKADYQSSVNQQVALVDQYIAQYARSIENNTRMLAEMPLFQEADGRITSYIDKTGPDGLVPMIPGLGDPYEKQVFDVLQAFQSTHPSVKNASLGVAVNGGFVKSPPSPRFDGYDARDRAWYQKAMQQPGKVVVSEIYRTSSQEDVILCVTTVKNGEGDIVGVVTVDFDLKDLSNAIAQMQIGKGGYVVLTDSKGYILAHPNDQTKIGKSLDEIGFGDFMSQNQVVSQTKRIRLEQKGFFQVETKVSQLNIFPLFYIVAVSESEFYDSAREIGLNLMQGVLILAVIALGLSYFTAGRLAKPLTILSQFTDQLASGNLEQRLDLQREDEIGQLAKRFNVMAEALESSKVKLEWRVQERTVALSDANKHLVETNEALHQTLELLQETQQQLIHSEKLAGLGSMVAGIAHEMNTPLGVSITWVSYAQELLSALQQTYQTQYTGEQDIQSFIQKSDEVLQALVRNLNRLSQLVEHFKQVAGDATTENKRQLNVYDYVSDLILKTHVALRGSNHTVDWHCKPDLVIQAYPSALAQILIHALDNILMHAYTPDQKGHISIGFEVVNQQGYLCIVDDGKGMSEEVARHAFEPFYTTNRFHGATGLGLHIVYNIVTLQLHGQVKIMTRLGKGTRLDITWPID